MFLTLIVKAKLQRIQGCSDLAMEGFGTFCDQYAHVRFDRLDFGKRELRKSPASMLLSPRFQEGH